MAGLKTTDIDSLTNTVMMQIDATMRKNEIHSYQLKNSEIRPTIRALMATILADHIAGMVIEETRENRGAVA